MEQPGMSVTSARAAQIVNRVLESRSLELLDLAPCPDYQVPDFVALSYATDLLRLLAIMLPEKK